MGRHTRSKSAKGTTSLARGGRILNPPPSDARSFGKAFSLNRPRGWMCQGKDFFTTKHTKYTKYTKYTKTEKAWKCSDSSFWCASW